MSLDNPGLILLPHQNGDCRLVSTGLEIRPGLGFDEWENIGLTLEFLAKSIQFALGDWLNYGEVAYGEKYAQAQSITEKNYQTLNNYAYVSRQVEIYRRRDDLSYSHHSEIAKYDSEDQVNYLAVAARDNLSVRALRAYIARNTTDDPPPATCPACGARLR
ncbi:hypothetical protein LCGC14_2668300 [marine sediment metagenome]|uniref:Uncharacterized protein n=1 Tax=marine sediment metagenome TaxID=412755 RepID=A0A0F8ZPV0_9ZZZZ